MKTLVLIRHGHRDTARRDADNGLTEKGREQARNVKRFFMSRFADADLKKGLWLLSSPKLRCVETLQPLAKALERSVDIHPGLLEQGPRESRGALEARVHAFLFEWSQSQVPLTILCSHGDWLPLAIHHLLGLAPELKKGSWFEVEWQAGRGELRWCLPSFKNFFT